MPWRLSQVQDRPRRGHLGLRREASRQLCIPGATGWAMQVVTKAMEASGINRACRLIEDKKGWKKRDGREKEGGKPRRAGESIEPRLSVSGMEEQAWGASG